jgi:hypothetical protein
MDEEKQSLKELDFNFNMGSSSDPNPASGSNIPAHGSTS